MSTTMRQMLEAGVHFGHQTRYWNPKMAPYIFGHRNKIHIINLETTLVMYNEAMKYVRQLAANKGTILFVGTKRSAREIVRESRPALADRIEHLRDLNPERLDLSLPGLYALVKDIPCTMDARAIEALAGRRAAVRTAVEALDLRNGQFPVRDAALFIVSECARARMAADLLDRADAAALGQAMNVSHDGERVAAAPIRATDRYLDGLIARSARPESLVEAGVALWQQPGGYGCSTPQIDRMVDCARTQPGVLGAQLAGAGLGGCVMVLLKREAVEPTQQALAEGYYEPNGLEPRTFVCEPSGGSQVLTTVEAPPAAP